MMNPFLQMPRRRNPFEDLLRQSPSPNLPYGGVSDEDQGPEPGYEGRDSESYLSAIQDAYLKEGPAQSAYREHLKNIPQNQGPSKMRRLGAALVGGATGYQQGAGAGFGIAEHINEAPYRQQLEQYGMEEEGLGRAAKMESDQNLRRVQYAREVRASAKDQQDFEAKMRNYDLQADKNSNTNYLAQRRIEQSADSEYGRNVRHDEDLGERRTARNEAGKRFEEGQTTTRRGQDMSSGTARRGQDMADKRAKDRLEFDKTKPMGSNQSAPLNETRADAQALTDTLRNNPTWSRFVDENGDPTEGAELDPEYEMFVADIDRRRNKMLGKGGRDIALPKETNVPTYRIK